MFSSFLFSCRLFSFVLFFSRLSPLFCPSLHFSSLFSSVLLSSVLLLSSLIFSPYLPFTAPTNSAVSAQRHRLLTFPFPCNITSRPPTVPPVNTLSLLSHLNITSDTYVTLLYVYPVRYATVCYRTCYARWDRPKCDSAISPVGGPG